MFKQYYQLTKPGIILGNAAAAIAGFFLASHRHINSWLLIETLIGISLVIASACVFNNYFDREIDSKMSRTKHRALVTGRISTKNALIYGAVLGIIGFAALAIFTNFLTVLVGLIGLFFYVVVYGITKRRSVYGTLIGSIAGATPPVAGYLAVSNHIDASAIILFFILVFWQMPHFYAIAIVRLKDYSAAGLPMLPVKKGLLVTKRHIIVYILAFEVAALSLAFYGQGGKTYYATTLVLSFVWLMVGMQGFEADDVEKWARSMFKLSLVVLGILCVAIASSGYVA